MRVSDTNKNRGAHGDSSFKLGGMPSSSENPPALAGGSVKDCIYRKEATKFIEKCLKHEDQLQSVERETLIAVKKNLENIPAADVRPVVRGKWVESKSMMEVVYCSECGFRTIYGAMPDGLGRNYSYCPNCGADMRDGNDGT